MMSQVLLLPEESSFQLEAYVEAPGWVRIVPRGYLVSEWAGKKWITPLIPQMFYGATGEQLTTWRQYIPKAGWQVIMSRRAGEPKIPREQLPWRQLEDPPNIIDFLFGVFIGAVIVGPFIWTYVGREMAKVAIAKGAEVAAEKVEEWLRKGEAKVTEWIEKAAE